MSAHLNSKHEIVSDDTRCHLHKKGFSAETVEALIQIDSEFFSWVRKLAREEDIRIELLSMGVTLERVQFHTLLAVARINLERAAQIDANVTIGRIAEELNLDPSRASRLTSQLIKQGYLERLADQNDGRKSLLKLTLKSLNLLQAFQNKKLQRFSHIFSTWESEDIQCFARLFSKFRQDIDSTKNK